MCPSVTRVTCSSIFLCCVVPPNCWSRLSTRRPPRLVARVTPEKTHPLPLPSREEYLPRGDFFFQWWNYLVYDSQTDDHFNIIYQVTDYAPASSRSDVASVSVVHMRGSRTLATASMDIPLAQLEVVGDLGLVYRAADGSIPFRQEVIDDATYRLYAEFPADKVSTGQPLGWELTFHRIHGMYGGQDQEEGNKAELCFIVSTLFAHNSRVQGVFRSAEQEFRFEDKPR